MSNRSYLFVCTPDGQSSGLCEQPYEVSLTQQILVSGNVRMVNSRIWTVDMPVALEGDFDEGCKRLFAFYDNCLAKGIISQEVFDDLSSKAHEALDQWLGKNATVLLEPAEIFEMEDPDDHEFAEDDDDEDGFAFLNWLLKDMHENIFSNFNSYLKDSTRQLSTFKESGADDAITEALDVDWSDVLFYELGSENDDD